MASPVPTGSRLPTRMPRRSVAATRPCARASEVDLMARVGAGEATARRMLLERFEHRIRRIASSILGVQADVEDAVQMISMEVLTSAPGFRGENLPAWIDRIAVRTSMRSARERHHRAMRNAGSEPLLYVPAEPGEETFEHALPKPLAYYLDQLPAEQRTTLVLRHAHGLSIMDIASKMEVSPNTVKYRLTVARQQMRRLIRRDVVVGAHREALESF